MEHIQKLPNEQKSWHHRKMKLEDWKTLEYFEPSFSESRRVRPTAGTNSQKYSELGHGWPSLNHLLSYGILSATSGRTLSLWGYSKSGMLRPSLRLKQKEDS